MPKFRDNCPKNHQQDDINIDTAKSILPMNKTFISTKQKSPKNKQKFDRFYCTDILNELPAISYFTKPDIKTYFKDTGMFTKIEKYLNIYGKIAKIGFINYFRSFMMKRLFPLLATMVVLLPLFFLNVNASPPEECLKMIWPNDYHQVWNEEWQKWDDVGSINPDSVRVDSCNESITYGNRFAKKYFAIQFESNYYPFDNVLDTGDVKEVDNISLSKPKLKQQFLNFEEQFGKLYFKGREDPDNEQNILANPVFRIYFENYNDITAVTQYIKTNIDSAKNCVYMNRAGILVNVDDSIITENTIIIEPTPATNIIRIIVCNNLLSNRIIEIYSNNGQLIKTLPYNQEINISDLSTGIYFIKCANQLGKFIRE